MVDGYLVIKLSCYRILFELELEFELEFGFSVPPPTSRCLGTGSPILRLRSAQAEGSVGRVALSVWPLSTFDLRL